MCFSLMIPFAMQPAPSVIANPVSQAYKLDEVKKRRIPISRLIAPHPIQMALETEIALSRKRSGSVRKKTAVATPPIDKVSIQI